MKCWIRPVESFDQLPHSRSTLSAKSLESPSVLTILVGKCEMSAVIHVNTEYKTQSFILQHSLNSLKQLPISSLRIFKKQVLQAKTFQHYGIKMSSTHTDSSALTCSTQITWSRYEADFWSQTHKQTSLMCQLWGWWHHCPVSVHCDHKCVFITLISV